MSLKILAPALLLLGLGVGVVIGRGTVDGPTPAYVDALEADNERLQDELRGRTEVCAPGLDAGSQDAGSVALRRLQKGGCSDEETLSLLEELTPEEARTLDLPALLGPILETEGYKVVKVLGRLEPSPQTLERLDGHVIKGAATGSTTQAVLAHYLRYTGRFQWADARPVVEAGLEASTRETRGVFLLTALELQDGPDEEWVRWAQTNYQFSDPVRLLLRKRPPR